MGGTLKKKLQVFVSSTYMDMIAERQAAVDAILRAGHIPAGMELFAAGDETQLETIRRWIDDSDVFMLILGGRYGSIDTKSGKSYIHLEYEYAIERQKPSFAAVMSDARLDEKVKADGRGVMELRNQELLEGFISVVKGKTSRFFNDVNELKLIVLESLLNIERGHDLPGWIKGSELVDARKTLDELTRLQNENFRLRQQVQQLSGSLHGQNRELPSQVAEKLASESRELLISALYGSGRIEIQHSNAGQVAVTGNRTFFMCSPRDEAKWMFAIEELEEYKLIVRVGLARDPLPSFKLTKRGYDVGDQAKLMK